MPGFTPSTQNTDNQNTWFPNIHKSKNAHIHTSLYWQGIHKKTVYFCSTKQTEKTKNIKQTYSNFADFTEFAGPVFLSEFFLLYLLRHLKKTNSRELWANNIKGPPNHPLVFFTYVPKFPYL